MLSISHWTLLSLEQSAQTIIFAPSIMALIGGPMIRRPQTSHRIGLFHLNSFINLLLFIVFVLLITIPCEMRLTDFVMSKLRITYDHFPSASASSFVLFAYTYSILTDFQWIFWFGIKLYCTHT